MRKFVSNTAVKKISQKSESEKRYQIARLYVLIIGNGITVEITSPMCMQKLR